MSNTFKAIKTAIDAAPRNAYVAELHVQTIKHSEELAEMSGRDFCAAVGIPASFGTEFLKMRKIADRLKAAGLDVSKL